MADTSSSSGQGDFAQPLSDRVQQPTVNVSGFTPSAGSVSNAQVATDAEIAQTKIASSLGKADLSADIGYFNGASGPVAVTVQEDMTSVFGPGVSPHYKIANDTLGSGHYTAVALGNYVWLVGEDAGLGSVFRVALSNDYANGITAEPFSVDSAGNTVVSATLTAGAVVSDGDISATGAATVTGSVTAAGMRTQRHPYTGDRHIESGTATVGAVGTTGSVAVTFTDAYASTPHPTATPQVDGFIVWCSSVSTTGFTINVRDVVGVATVDVPVSWRADGSD